MRKLIYFITILAIFTSCQKEEVKTQIQQQKVPEEQIDGVLKTDSVTANDFGEHKSIHQIEWEEHHEELGVDSIKVSSN